VAQRNDVLINLLKRNAGMQIGKQLKISPFEWRKFLNRYRLFLVKFGHNSAVFMAFTKIKFFLAAISIIAVQNMAIGQVGLCPSNLDFEQGDFTNWICQAGIVDPAGNIIVSPTPPIPGRHTIITAATAGIDPWGLFPENCPNGSGYSVKLGNSSGGHQAESISYTYTIPSTLTVFSMIFHYAVVLQDPNHLVFEQPRFRARIRDLSTNSTIPCVDFDFAASASLPGFLPSPSGGGVIYKDWTPITINLTPYIGRTILLEFITNDCVYTAHFGYAYVDVNTNCNGAISGSTICQGDNSITLTAPFGFQNYAWYSDNTFTTILSTQQTLLLNPAPPVGAVYPVIVTPYPGFGCIDTLYATITVSPKPISVAGPDVGICKSQQVQIGGPATPGYTYSWTTAGQVSNATISNPFAWINAGNPPTEFYIKTTDILTGCFSYDTTILANKQIDTSMIIAGKVDFCINETPAATLSVKNISTAVQWYEVTTGPIPGATGISYQPLVTGNYWAQITQNGCIDTTSVIPIAIHPLPLPVFTSSSDTGCVTKNSFLFKNNSTSPDNASMTYLWKFSDGNTVTTTDATRTFSPVGSYNIELVSTTQFGCKDSSNKTVYILPNGIPDFLWDSICVNRPMLFTNRSNEKGSVQVNYNWNFNNGGPASLLKNPLPVVYTTQGKADVTLKLVTLGCENDTMSITRNVQVNRQAPGYRYRTITMPEGSSTFLHVRDSIGKIYNWRPQMQLSSYSTRYTEFFATTNDVEYKIDITDSHTCVTTDTLEMLILRKPGYYLPTAFTPNGDGLNDIAIPYLVGMKSLKSFSVFNRWGNLVFYSTKEGEGWDGKSRGLTQDAGVYVWILEFINSQNKKVTEKGTITIIR
jgi:gliding motility-associated-like protein